MLQFDEYKVKLNNLAPALKELAQALDLESAERELDMLQAESAADGFWDNLAKAQKVQQRIKNLQDKVDSQNKRQRQWDDLMALCEMGNEFEDESLLPELEEGFAQLEANMESARLETLLTGEYDRSPGVKSNIRSIYSDYLLDLSISYGREMESAMHPDNAYPSDIPVPDFLFPEMPSYHLSSEDKYGISP